MPYTLTVLARVRAGEEAALRAVLREIGGDIAGKKAAGSPPRPHIDFTAASNFHFARFALLTDPQRGTGATRLLFASVYDGDLDSHVAELVRVTSGMDAIWGRCEGYSDSASFSDFVRAHAHAPAAFYSAFRDESVASLRAASEARRHAHALADAASPVAVQSLAERLPPVRLPERLAAAVAKIVHRSALGSQRVVRALPLGLDFVRAVGRHGLSTVWRATLRIITTLDRYPIFRVVNRLTRNRMPARKSPYSSVALDNCAPLTPIGDGDELPIPSGQDVPPMFREDAVAQNQLTLVTRVNRSEVQRVKAVLAAIDAYAKRLSPPGSLIGVSTIHFVRWLLIDDDRRLVLLSDYDGSWENYIDEFAETILSGLDAIWETSYGYPPDGARDLPAFKRFLRAHQVPAEIFYSAYPDASVLNLRRDVELAHTLAAARTTLRDVLSHA